MGIPAMDHNRFDHFLGQLQLLAEKIILLFLGVLHPVIIQTELAHRHHLGMLQKLSQYF